LDGFSFIPIGLAAHPPVLKKEKMQIEDIGKHLGQKLLFKILPRPNGKILTIRAKVESFSPSRVIGDRPEIIRDDGSIISGIPEIVIDTPTIICVEEIT
jgi:hypothetical protein